MKPARRDWIAGNNEAWRFSFPLRNAAGPFNLTGYSAIKMQLRRYPEAAEVDLDLSLGAGLTVDTPTDGTIEGAASLSQIQNLFGSYVYDVKAISSGQPVVLVTGSIDVRQGVTR